MAKSTLIDTKKATHLELLEEYERVMDMWGKYSCDSFGFYLGAIHDAIVDKGGWPGKE